MKTMKSVGTMSRECLSPLPLSRARLAGGSRSSTSLHGTGGVGTLDAGPIVVTDFKEVVEDLAKNGEAVYATLAPRYETSEVHAQDIAKQIDDILARTGKAKGNLIAHAQGGLHAGVLRARTASGTAIASPR